MDRLIGGHERHAAVRGRSAEPTGPPPDLASPKRFWLAHFGVSMPSNFMDAVVLRSERALALPSIRNWPIRPEDNAPREVPSRLLSLAWFHRPWTSSGVAGVKGRWLTKISYSQSKIASGGRPRALTPLIIAASKSLRTGAGSVVAIANRPARACTRATMT